MSQVPVPPPDSAPLPAEPLAGEYVEQEAQIMVASQWMLMWWKLRRHKLAMISGVIVILFYLVAIFVEFLQVKQQDEYAANYTYAPPQALHLIDTSSGTTQIGLYVSGYKVSILEAHLCRRSHPEDPREIICERLGV